MAVIWRAMPGYKGLYEVSNGGSVRSIDRIVWVKGHCHYRKFPGVLLKPIPIKTGMHYLSVDLQKEGNRTKFCIHTLVLRAFKGPRPPGKQARHLNGNICDNRNSNLKWGTARKNNQDKHRHGTVIKGIDIHNSVLTEKKVRKIRRLYAIPQSSNAKRTQGTRPNSRKYSLRHLANRFHVTCCCIYRVVSNKSWKHIA